MAEPNPSRFQGAWRRSRPRRRAEVDRLHLGAIAPTRLFAASQRFLDHHLLDWAAALTFYAAISLLPAMLIVLAILGLLGESTLDQLSDNLRDQSAGPMRDLVLEALDQVATGGFSAGATLLVGVVGALWSASGYVGGFMRAAGVIHGRPERYPIWKLRPLQLALTGATIIAIAGTALVVVVTGPVATELAELLGIERIAAEIWDLAKWPLVVVFVLTIFAVLYWAAPDVRERGFQWLTPGGVIATAAWVIGSAGYAVWVQVFADYGDLYGSLGAVIGFVVWLWLSNMAMLYGVEVNAEFEDAGPRDAEVSE